MVAAKPKLLIFVGSAGGETEKKCEKLLEILEKTLEKDACSIERLKTPDFSNFLPTLPSESTVLILAGYKPDLDEFSQKNLQAIKKFVIPSDPNGLGGKILTFCDNLNDDSNFWLLKNAFPDKPQEIDNLLDLFKRLASGRDIPVNRQVGQLTQADDFAAAVGRLENSAVFLDTSSENGAEILMVSGSLEENLLRSPRVWSALCQMVNLDTVSLVPQPKKDDIAVSVETVLVYNGKVTDEPFDLAVNEILKKCDVKFQHVNAEKLKNDATNLKKICNALILASENCAQDFDDVIKRRLLEYFLAGGKLLFLGDQKVDAEWLWFLKNAFGDDQLFSKVLSSFEKFSAGGRVPVSLQGAKMAAPDKQNFCVALVHAGDHVPVLYLSAENSGVVAFVKTQPVDLMDEGPEAWKDLLRLMGVSQAPGQDQQFIRERVLGMWKDGFIKQKPPNLYIHAANEDDFRKYANFFSQVLHRYTYVIYPLSSEHLHSLPWAPYCRTLFLAPQPSSAFDEVGRRRIVEYFDRSAQSAGAVDAVPLDVGGPGGRIMQFLTAADLTEPQTADADPLWLLKCAVGGDEKLAGDLASRFRRFVETNSMPTNLLTKPTGKTDKNAPEYYAAMLRIKNLTSVLYLAPDPQRAVALVVGQPDEKTPPVEAEEIWQDLLRMLDLDVTSSFQPKLTSGYLFCRNEDLIKKACESMKAVTAESTPSLLFVKVAASTDAISPTFPIRVGEKRDDFGYGQFFRCLSTEHLGECLIFIPVARSLMQFITCFNDLVSNLGIVVVAKEQTSSPNEVGKVWLSPIGTATFAFNVKLAKSSLLGQKIGFVKCLATLALLNGIKGTTSYIETLKHSAFPVGLRWPDDIYYDNGIKIGTVFTKFSTVGQDYVIALGFGVNVCNKRPTACLNDFVSEKVSPFNVETIIGSILNEFEKLLAFCQKEGTLAVAALFDKEYLDINSEISLWKTGVKGKILGVSDEGHLRVKLKSDDVINTNSDPSVELCTNSLNCLIPIRSTEQTV